MQKKPAQEDIKKLISIIQQQRPQFETYGSFEVQTTTTSTVDGWYTSNQCLCDSDGDIVDYPQEDYMPHLPSWS
ncbi:unnamed protein product [Natator depressus]